MNTNALDRILNKKADQYSQAGYCYGVEDGMDGYCVHDIKCPDKDRRWTGPNSTCIKPPQRSW